jgi:DNA-binding NtrC family response regulator
VRADAPHLVVQGPGGKPVLTVRLGAERVIVLGRTPEAGGVDLGDGEAPRGAANSSRSLQMVAVGSPSVSANHAAVWHDGQSICIRDLGSRNGTWLLLPKSQTVRVPDSGVVLQLAQTVGASPANDEPAEPQWSRARDFSEAMATSLEQWLRAHGIEAHATVAPRAAGDLNLDGVATRIPLASGDELDVSPVGTVDGTWPALLQQAWRWTTRQNAVYESEEDTRREGLVLASRAIRVAHREVVEAAKRGVPTLLLTGATGAGKEVLAEVFHRHSGRNGPFVAVNCAMLSKELLRSELFGHEAGAFTGASRRVVGAVERAQGGTLFLDEIGEVSPDIQAMLLRFLDRREFEHVGRYGTAKKADVRVVAATNRDLRAAARVGAFRPDLWFRLAVHEVEVPALRSRWDDIVAYLETVRTEGGRSMLESVSEEGLALLRDHAWEGNFRELRSFAERLARSTAGQIDAARCRAALDRGALNPRAKTPQPGDPTSGDWGSLAARALHAFVEDRGRPPQNWDDQKEWNEKYLKPLLFFHLAAAASHPSPADEDELRTLAAKLATGAQADRGTAVKQLTRYFERFHA